MPGCSVEQLAGALVAAWLARVRRTGGFEQVELRLRSERRFGPSGVADE